MCSRWHGASAGAAAGDPAGQNISCTPGIRRASLWCAIARVVSGVQALRKNDRRYRRHVVWACRSWAAGIGRSRHHFVLHPFRSTQDALQGSATRISQSSIHHTTLTTRVAFAFRDVGIRVWRLSFQICLGRRLRLHALPDSGLVYFCAVCVLLPRAMAFGGQLQQLTVLRDPIQ